MCIWLHGFQREIEKLNIRQSFNFRPETITLALANKSQSPGEYSSSKTFVAVISSLKLALDVDLLSRFSKVI
jgi:hypothetical protein